MLFAPTPEIDWNDLFGTARPVEIEIGCGKGAFLIAAAAAHPERNFLGIENQPRWVRFTRERIERHRLANVRIVAADATLVVSRFVRDGSVRALHVYFPDPWWKRRHQKRRLVTRELATHLHRVLEPQGTLYVATDVEDRFHSMLAELAAAPFEVRIGEEAPGRPPTNFERKYRAEGRRVYTAALKKE